MAYSVLFDKPYSADKIAEALAVQWAVVNGACDNCMYLENCASNKNFKFPQDALCMLKKGEFK